MAVRVGINGFGRIGRSFTRALLALIEDEDLRGRLGRQARLDADQYTVEAITQDWLALLDELDRKALTR